MVTEGLCCLADPCQAMESDTAPSLLLMENAPRARRLLWLGKKRVCQPGECAAQGEHGCNRLAPTSSKQCEIANAWGMSRWQLASKEGCCYVPSRFASAAWQSRQETSHTLFCKGKRCTRHPSWLFHLALVRSTRDPVRGTQKHGVREKALWFSLLGGLFPSPQSTIPRFHSSFLKEAFFRLPHILHIPLLYLPFSCIFSQPAFCPISCLLLPVPTADSLLPSPSSICMEQCWRSARSVLRKPCVGEPRVPSSVLVLQHPSEHILPSVTHG